MLQIEMVKIIILILLIYPFFSGKCTQVMAEEGVSPVTRWFNGVKINPGQAWKPTPGQGSELTLIFPAPADLTSIRITDTNSSVAFTLASTSDPERTGFVEVQDDNGNAKVTENIAFILFQKHKLHRCFFILLTKLLYKY